MYYFKIYIGTYVTQKLDLLYRIGSHKICFRKKWQRLPGSWALACRGGASKKLATSASLPRGCGAGAESCTRRGGGCAGWATVTRVSRVGAVPRRERQPGTGCLLPCAGARGSESDARQLCVLFHCPAFVAWIGRW
jgi:hypothetical protein